MITSKTDRRAKKRKILVADESITIQKLVNLTFAGTNFEVIGASDGADAMTKVKRLQPDIVLADAQLRQIDGLKLCESIRSDSSLFATRVVVLKGSVAKDFEDRLFTVKVDGILAKPFDAKALTGLVDRLLSEEDSTVVKETQKVVEKNAAKKLEAIAAEVAADDDDYEAETVTKRVQPLPIVQGEEEPTKKLRPGRGDIEDENTDVTFSEPIKVSSIPSPEVSAVIETAPKVSNFESMARAEIRDWIDKNLPAMAEKILKEEISRLADSRS